MAALFLPFKILIFANFLERREEIVLLIVNRKGQLRTYGS